MSLFSWTTPGRCNGERCLPIIPNEVYFQIFSYMQPDPKSPPDTFTTLSQVCRFFCAYFLAKSYKELDFDCTKPLKHHVNFCRALAKGDKSALSVASYVKECTVRIHTNAPSTLDKGYSGVFMFALRHLTNLRGLSLVGIELTTKHLTTISQLQRLERLRLEWPKWNTNDLSPLEKLSRPLSLEITGYFGDPSLASSPPRLLISKLHLTRLAGFLWEEIAPLLQLQVDGSVSLPLQSLMINLVGNVLLLQEFLSRTPSIEELHFLAAPGPAARPSTSIPRLKKLLCPPSWFNLLLAGRTLPQQLSVLAASRARYLSKTLSQDLESDIIWTTHNNVCADRLVIPAEWAKAPLASVISKCSTLGLIYSSNTRELNIDAIGGQGSIFSNINSLFFSLTRPISEKTVPFTQITRKFPAALCIQVDGLGEWVRPPDAIDEWKRTEETYYRVSQWGA